MDSSNGVRINGDLYKKMVLRKGDIILGVNDTQITDLNMLERALQSTSGRLWLNLLRGDSEFYFVLR